MLMESVCMDRVIALDVLDSAACKYPDYDKAWWGDGMDRAVEQVNNLASLRLVGVLEMALVNYVTTKYPLETCTTLAQGMSVISRFEKCPVEQWDRIRRQRNKYLHYQNAHPVLDFAEVSRCVFATLRWAECEPPETYDPEYGVDDFKEGRPPLWWELP
jgi:hypothetical protein